MNNKLILGTVQLGLDYGVNNTQGKPSLDAAFDILNTAYDNNIRLLDTAEAYGNSQEVIGLFHKKFSNKKFDIISKISPKGVRNEEALFLQLKRNCKTLNVTNLYGYMFHHYKVLKENESIYDSLLNAKKVGLTKKIGISLYSNVEIQDIIDNYSKFDIIQIPFNLFDNAKQRKEIILKARVKGIEIHTRSAFLQGLFFMDIEKIPSKIKTLSDNLKQIKSLQKKHDLDTPTITLKYVAQKEYIDYVVIGVDSSKQLLNNIYVMNQKKTVPHQEIDAINIKNTALLNPSNW